MAAAGPTGPDLRRRCSRGRTPPRTPIRLIGVRARDEAQARTGIPVVKRAFLYSSVVDSIHLPIVMCMGPGDEAATARALKRDFNERYRDLGPRVLAFCISTYQHGNIDGLKRAAGVA